MPEHTFEAVCADVAYNWTTPIANFDTYCAIVDQTTDTIRRLADGE